MARLLAIIDMQNDFITGSLGTNNAMIVLAKVVDKIKNYDFKNIYATMDTHNFDYFDTLEGKSLPVLHCIKGTYGWRLPKVLYECVCKENIIEKSSFASLRLGEKLLLRSQIESIEIELVGFCTDICVVSNALLLKSMLPDVKIYVDSSCCAGASFETHKCAIQVMKMCQINVI